MVINNSDDNVQAKGLKLPEDVRVTGLLGSGGRAKVFRGKMNDKDVVVKVYNEAVIKKYKEKYKVDIAQFEFNRNASLFKIDKIREFIAEPFRCYSSDSMYTHSIIQEFVSGVILEDLIIDLGGLPEEILNTGYLIVKNAEKNKIHDLDISAGNLKIFKSGNVWKPMLYDFNIMPQYMYPPNKIVELGYKLGIRKKSFRDYRSLRNWEARGKKKIWLGRT